MSSIFSHNTFRFYLTILKITFSNGFIYDDEKKSQVFNECFYLKCKLRESIPDTRFFYYEKKGEMTIDTFLLGEEFDILINLDVNNTDFSKTKSVGYMKYVSKFYNTFMHEEQGNNFQIDLMPKENVFKKFYNLLIENDKIPDRAIITASQKLKKDQNHGEMIFDGPNDGIDVTGLDFDFTIKEG